MEEPEPHPLILSPSNSLRRRSSDSKSPEFEFWMVRNPSFPQPNLLSADELFSDGFLLPLHLLNNHHDPPEPSGSDLTQKPEVSTIDSFDLSDASTLISSKRWRGIFRKSDNNNNINADDQEGTNVKKKEKKKNVVSGGVGRVSVAELNINIWPFSRSRSAGNGGTRPRSTAAVSRKVSSAPCSRSNSGGESKTRKWPASPSRGGVHLGRNSPVWQVRNPRGGARSAEGVIKSGETGMKKDGNESHRKIPPAGRGGGGSRARVLSLNVPMCIGYRNHLSCKSDENSAVSIAAVAASGGGVSVEGVRGSNFLNIRGLFSKKVY